MNLTSHDYKPEDFLTPEELCRLLKIEPRRYRSDLKMFRRFKPIQIAHGHTLFSRPFVMALLANDITRAGIPPITKKRL